MSRLTNSFAKSATFLKRRPKQSTRISSEMKGEIMPDSKQDDRERKKTEFYACGGQDSLKWRLFFL